MKNDALTQITTLGIETSIDSKDLNLASRDASLFHVEPEAIVSPKSEEISQIIKVISEKKSSQPTLSLTARAAGTDMSGGPLTESIVMNMTKHFTKILSVNPETKSAITEPGVFYRDFEKKTLEHNLIVPSYPASRELCTVGGMVANNSGGEKTLAYGKTERYVNALRIVLSDGSICTMEKLSRTELAQKKELHTLEGKIYRDIDTLIQKNLSLIQYVKPDVTKNSAGYGLWNVYDPTDRSFDLAQLIVGSQGTLGMITQIEFSLIHPKPHARMLVVLLPDMKRVAEVAGMILKHKPESFESYDDHTLAVAMKVLPDLIKKMKGNILKLAFQFLPEAWMALTGGLPKLVLIAEFTADSEEEAQKMAESARKDVAKMGIKCRTTHSEAEGQKYWTIRRESFSLLRKHIKELRTAPFIDDFVVHPNQLSDFLPELYEILNPYKLVLTVAGHVGDANFHIIPLMDTKKPETRQIIEELSQKVYDLVLRYHGSITGEHNDGLIRTPFLEQMYGKEMTTLFAQVKNIFDPQNIFNPGKKVNGDFGYAMDHLDVGRS
ncbi:FAD-binding oxidoreductase [Candidatus Uhrbacteria bacterium]|nr:FAD-binding oxidoreductase [Candidatus Uhrbacteria bacterium]